MLLIRTERNVSANHFNHDVILWLYHSEDTDGPCIYARNESNTHPMGERLVTLRLLEQDGRYFGALIVDAVTSQIFFGGRRAHTGRGKPYFELSLDNNHNITVVHRDGLETVKVCFSEPGTVFNDAAERTLVPGMDEGIDEEIEDEPVTEEALLIAVPSHNQDRQHIPPIGAVSPRQPWQPRFVPAPRKFYLVRNLLRAGFVVAILAPMGQDLPTINLPGVTLPEVTLPQFSLPAVHLPQITLPQLSLPSVALPALPTIDLEPTPARLDGPWTIHRDGTLEFVHGGAIWSGDFFVEKDVIYQMNNRPLPVACLTYYGWLPICPEIVRYSQTPALP